MKRRQFFGKNGEYVSHSKLVGDYKGKSIKRLDTEFYRRKIDKGLELGTIKANIELFIDEKGKLDLKKWIVTIIGPWGTLYENGVFNFEFRFSEQYPFKPPAVFTLQKIYLSAAEDHSGAEIYHPLSSVEEGWRSSCGVKEVILGVTSMFLDPGGGCGNDDAKILFNTDLQKFNKTAREWTKKYANHLPWTCKKEKDNFEYTEERLGFLKAFFISMMCDKKNEQLVESTISSAYITIRFEIENYLSIPKWI